MEKKGLSYWFKSQDVHLRELIEQLLNQNVVCLQLQVGEVHNG